MNPVSECQLTVPFITLEMDVPVTAACTNGIDIGFASLDYLQIAFLGVGGNCARGTTASLSGAGFSHVSRNRAGHHSDWGRRPLIVINAQRLQLTIQRLARYCDRIHLHGCTSGYLRVEMHSVDS